VVEVRDVKGFAVGLALVLSLVVSPLVAGEAVAKSHVSVGIGFGSPVYAAPYYPAPPVYYAPAPAYVPPPTYYYPPSTVIVPSPGYYELSPDDYGARPIYKRSWWHHEDQDYDDDD
jgi:hypothetical protein